MVRWLGITLLLLLVAVIANGFLSDVRQTSMAYDIEYLARHCTAIPAEHRPVIAQHILTDVEFDGNLYIYEQDLASGTTDVFEAAFRGRISQFLCVPGFGCLLPPTLSRECKRPGG
jgi:hypothetical protein